AYKHVHEDMPPPSSAVSGIPPALDALVVRATRRDPAERPADGSAFLAELREVSRALPGVGVSTGVDHQTLVVQRPPTVVPPKTPMDVRRKRGLIAVASVLVLALLALGGGFYLGSYRYTKAPGVVKLSLSAAQAKLQRAGLEARTGDEVFSETITKGLVAQQDPKPDGRVRKGGKVTLFVSKGPDRRRVPALANKTQAEATKALRDAGLTVNGTVQREHSSSVPRDRVTRTTPDAGQALKPGTLVTLFLSDGPEQVAVTDVTGKTQAEATQILSDDSFQVEVTPAFSDTVPAGTVMDQNPRGGGKADKGSTVTLTVSKGPDVVTLPDVKGKKFEDARNELMALGLQVKKYQPFPGGPGKVRSMDPNAGTKVRRGTTVTLGVF
ncbi:MAG: hypothetical protein JWM40_248, partial [Frankiales bacterium]|nr:hypothetical protein [Frankiales bacterium]